VSVVRKLEPLEPSVPGRRVAAYARVSRKTDALVNSLSAQVDYFASVIKANPNWEFAGIYADPWVTGTSIGPRREFQRLMEDCRGGKIDLVLTKSISRFARNTVELLSAVRELKTLGVEVRFETEKISTRSGEGELMLTLLAALAEEESRSLSGNVRWAIDKRYQEGRPFAHQKLFGYRWRGDELEPVPQEAELVKAVFDAYTQGKGVAEIEKELGEQGRRAGRPLTRSGIWAILRNEQYTGCLLLRQSFNEKPRKRKRNRGERTMYLIEEHHPAIVTRE
jgi:DNA invertase Pin-like site-specific DNA recombinase